MKCLNMSINSLMKISFIFSLDFVVVGIDCLFMIVRYVGFLGIWYFVISLVFFLNFIYG